MQRTTKPTDSIPITSTNVVNVIPRTLITLAICHVYLFKKVLENLELSFLRNCYIEGRYRVR